ncbi:P2Y purinoceptor 1-like [Arapaima gigas]
MSPLSESRRSSARVPESAPSGQVDVIKAAGESGRGVTMVRHLDNDSINDHQVWGHLNQTASVCSSFGSVQWYCCVLFGLYAVAVPMGIVGNIVALKLSLRDIQTFCKAKKISFNINIYGSIMFLTFISFDRYAGTVHPLRSLKWWDTGKAKLCCICTWIFLFIGCLPDIFFTFVAKQSGDVAFCMDHAKVPSVYVKSSFIGRTLLGFLLPFSVMLAFYTMTVKVLCNPPRSRTAGQRSGKPLLLLSAAIVVFAVSFVPYHATVVILMLMQAGSSRVTVPHVCYEFSEAACSLSCCLDPLLYILAGERFHRGWQTIARRRCARGCCRRNHRIRVQTHSFGPERNMMVRVWSP